MSKQKRLESAVVAIQRQHGPKALRKGLPRRVAPPHIATGFPQFDKATGCGGLPPGQLTLLSGPATSGKLTLDDKTLAHTGHSAILDLNYTVDADYLVRCGANLDQLVIVQPEISDTVTLLLDLVGIPHHNRD